MWERDLNRVFMQASSPPVEVEPDEDDVIPAGEEDDPLDSDEDDEDDADEDDEPYDGDKD
jgi:hypothetical protein